MRKLVWLVVLLGSLLTARAEAQERLSPALALARICVSEAGWDCFTSGDGLAIHEVLLRGAEREGMSYVTFARAYSGRATGVREAISRAWVAGLNEAGTRPEGWPTHTSRVRCRDGWCAPEPHPAWSRYRDRWLAVLERAREVVLNTLSDWDEWGYCDGEIHDWGGGMDRARATRNGLVEVECGDTDNDFYARPHLLPPPVVEPDGCLVEIDPD